MGSYASLKIKDYELAWMKSYVNPAIMSIFVESDRKEEIEKYDDPDEEDYKHIYYIADVKTVKTRLNIMGFNLKTIETSFEKFKNESLENCEGSQKDIKLLKDFTFDDYLRSLNDIQENDVDLFSNFYTEEEEKKAEELIKKNPYVKYILEAIEYSDQLDDFRLYLRGFLENIKDETKIILDVSEIIYAGYYDEREKIAENNLTKNDKTIIFTEGKYDTFVIKESMKLLYPQYVDYFSFLDIKLSNLELGANRIITYLKSFISAGIINKVIVLFDNDAEGLFCRNELLNLNNIPSNFCIMAYPEIKIANNYPTICPTGIENLNINGSACSIELYHCEEVLKNKKGLIPVQWKSYNDKINKYQGSFSKNDKGKIQKGYNKILKECFKDNSCLKKYNFNNMKKLLDSIFEAFDNTIFKY